MLRKVITQWLAVGLFASGLAACAAADGGSSSGASGRPCGEGPVVGEHGPKGCGLVCRAEVPLDTRHGFPTAAMWLDGRPATMVIDTGAGISALTPPAARRLGLTRAVKLDLPVLGFGGLQRASAVTVAKAALAQTTFPSASFAVLVTASQSAAGEPDGVLGVDLLSRYEIDLDVPHHRMTLYSGKPCTGLLPGWTSEDAAVAFTPAVQAGRLIAVPITIQGQATTAILDSGAHTTIVAASFASRLGVAKQELDSDLVAVGSGAGPQQMLEVRQRFVNLRFGNETLPEIEAAVLTLSESYPYVFLGADYFGTHKVWISYSTGQVHLAHNW